MEIKKLLDMSIPYVDECIRSLLRDSRDRIAELEAQIVRLERFTKKQAKQLEVCAGKGRQDVYIPPKGTQFSHKVADEFWRVWELNGTYSQHGYYESTWMAIWAALKVDAPKEQQ